MGNSDLRAAEASIFICYRRDDSGYTTDRIYDWLNREFPGAVFRDLDAIPFGVDFRDHIRAVLESCQIVLAVIGPDWLTVTSNSGRRRIDDPLDHVRIEIEAALARKKVRVIPLLVRNANVPSPHELPAAIEALAYRHGHSIRRDPDFKTDMDRLIRQIRRALEQSPPEVSNPPHQSPMADEVPATGEAAKDTLERDPAPVDEIPATDEASKDAPQVEPDRTNEIPAGGGRWDLIDSETPPVEQAPGATSKSKWRVIAAFFLVLLVVGVVFLVKTREGGPTAEIITPSPEPVGAPTASPSPLVPKYPQRAYFRTTENFESSIPTLVRTG